MAFCSLAAWKRSHRKQLAAAPDKTSKKLGGEELQQVLKGDNNTQTEKNETK